jgi:CRISPR-associated protein Cst2
MSKHIHFSMVTHHGVAANNRGNTVGNNTLLQKLNWRGDLYTTVSAEAIRFALRNILADLGYEVNRSAESSQGMNPINAWQDGNFANWAKGKYLIDDDLFGFMLAQSAKKSNDDENGSSTKARRGALEISRAVSLTPFQGDMTFNAASPGASPGARTDKAKKDNSNQTPVIYSTEVHATQYQFGGTLSPERLMVQKHADAAIEALVSLGGVAGNHSRFLFDFSPQAIVLRVTSDPAPRILYIFEEENGVLNVPALVRRIQAGDIDASELYVGGELFPDTMTALKNLGAQVFPGVKRAGMAAQNHGR